MFVIKYISFVCFLFIHNVVGVNDDYYIKPALRSISLTCQDRFHQIFCQVKCGTIGAFCIQEECYCLQIINANDERQIQKTDHDMSTETKEENKDYVESEPLLLADANQNNDDSFYALRPAPRHHIAHFCPNLELARSCIKKCMEVGKPAFCGKDHVCYCGHKYEDTQDDAAGGNVKDIYAQFKDMYAKYFGTEKDTREVN